MNQPAAPEAPAPRYNRLFAEFTDVPDGDYLEGLVAYALYKKAKREWAAGIWRDKGRAPNEAELELYANGWTEVLVDSVRSAAKTSLNLFAQDAVKQETPAIEKRVLRGTGWSAVGYGMLTNLSYTVLLIIVALILKFSGIDALSILTSVQK